MAALTLAPVPGRELTVLASWPGEQPYTVDWGDGTERVRSRPGMMHRYANPGPYTASLIDTDGTPVASASVFVRPGGAPQVTFMAADDNPNIVDAVWADDPAELVSIYDVHWGDTESHLGVIAGPGHAIAHGYRAGIYTARVRDRNAKRWGAYTFTVNDPVYDPEFDLTRVDERTARATISRLETPGKDVLVDWGDGYQDTLPAAQVGDSVDHTYDFDDSYIVQAVYSDGSTDGSADVVTIPWPAQRGPKPTSEVIWSADAVEARGVWLRWVGSGWHYTIHWGDGTTDRVTSWGKSTKHVYAQVGTYTVVCVSDLHQDWTATAEVTVRDSTAVEASFALTEPNGNRVRATLAQVSSPVRYRIAWGDGTVTEHDGSDLAPVHEYAWETPSPAITVIDVPARRTGRFTGPAIGPDPSGAPISGWFFKHLPTADETEVRRFALIGGGLQPGQQVTWWPWSNHWTRTVTADGRGEVRDEIDIPISQHPWDDFNTWRSYTVELPDKSLRFVPVHNTRTGREPDVTYEIDPDSTAKLWFSVSPQMLGEHHIDYGDGSSETVQVDSLPLRVAHTFTGPAFSTITVTLPDGRTVKGEANVVRPCPPSHNSNYPGHVSITWYYPPEHCGEYGRDLFSPIIIDDGYHRRLQLHCPNFNRDTGAPGGWHAGFALTGFPAGLYNVVYRSPFQKDRVHEVRVTAGAKVRQVGPPQVVEVTLPDVDADITAWFGDITEWEGGYSGKFHVTNHTESPVPWQVEFTLADPARLREVWPEAAQFTDLGGSRWRIWSDLNLDESIVVGARIEPPGKTKKFPDDITARERTVPPPGGDDEEG